MIFTTDQEKRRAVLRVPRKEDGAAVHALVEACKPLDLNSVYLYLLVCTHFAGTSVVAEVDGKIAGFTSAYVPPERPDTIFIWQVAVGEAARGQGLAKRLLREILSRPACRDVRFMETTVTPSNQPSRRLFASMSAELQADLTETVAFAGEDFGKANHEAEVLFRIGPFAHPEKKGV
jgi:L-2,4-diaminobutyric acid acetyltransferase